MLPRPPWAPRSGCLPWRERRHTRFGRERSPARASLLRGKGVPKLRGSRRGDLYAHIEVHIPKRLNRDQRELFERLGKALKREPGACQRRVFRKAARRLTLTASMARLLRWPRRAANRLLSDRVSPASLGQRRARAASGDGNRRCSEPSRATEPADRATDRRAARHSSLRLGGLRCRRRRGHVTWRCHPTPTEGEHRAFRAGAGGCPVGPERD